MQEHATESNQEPHLGTMEKERLDHPEKICGECLNDSRRKLPLEFRVELAWFSQDLLYTLAIDLAGGDGLPELAACILMRLEQIAD